MKIEFDDKDLEYIDKLNEDLRNGEDIPLFVHSRDKKYNIEFTCYDIAKANMFLSYIMNPRNTIELREYLGINITGIKYDIKDDALMNLRDYLQKMINDIDNKRGIFYNKEK